MKNIIFVNILLVVVVLIIVGIVSGEAQAASFDCSKASTFIEKAICSNQRLSELDDLLMVSYKKALANSKNPAALKTSQRNWLKKERDLCQMTECLEKAYIRRLAELKVEIAAEPTVPSVLGARNQGELQPIGKYHYVEKGFAGEMVVSEM